MQGFFVIWWESLSEVPTSYLHSGREVLNCSWKDGTVHVSLLYDVRTEPLYLSAPAQLGDSVCIIVRPHRIDLYVRLEKMDEEWPYGQLLLPKASSVSSGATPEIWSWEDVSGTEGTLKALFRGNESPSCLLKSFLHRVQKEELPDPRCVLGTFSDAEHWQPGYGVNIGDCMPYVDEGRYHVLYLKDRRHHGSKWGIGAHQWGHVSTEDFVTWQIHPMAVEIDRPEEGSICTGSHIRIGQAHHLYYSVRSVDGSPAMVRRSVSEDGYHYVKDTTFGFSLPDQFDQASARDPKVVQDEKGLYHMLVTTSLVESSVSSPLKMRGCLAHLISTDTQTWTALPDPIYLSDYEEQPECSDYFTAGGWHYLVFSLYAKGQYLLSREAFTDWQMPADGAIPSESVPKCAVYKGHILFTGFQGNGQWGGHMFFSEAFQQPDGTLRFEKNF